MKKADVKAVGIVVAGVAIAGFLMHQLRGIGPVAQARAGYQNG